MALEFSERSVCKVSFVSQLTFLMNFCFLWAILEKSACPALRRL